MLDTSRTSLYQILTGYARYCGHIDCVYAEFIRPITRVSCVYADQCDRLLASGVVSRGRILNQRIPHVSAGQALADLPRYDHHVGTLCRTKAERCRPDSILVGLPGTLQL
jgi:hypothetical protein